MKISIVTFTFLLSPVFSQMGYLSGRAGQQPELNKAMSDAGVQPLKCMNGYIGLDCTIPDAKTLSKLSCSLKGKPGKSKNGVFIYNDSENSGVSCKPEDAALIASKPPVAPVAPVAPVPVAPVAPGNGGNAGGPGAPVAPGNAGNGGNPGAAVDNAKSLAACPLIADIQKCMNKCITDVL